MVNALIALYEPLENVRNNVLLIQEQVDRVFLCDNSLTPNAGLFEDLSVHYIYYGENLGLPRAYNRVLKDPSYNFENDDYIVFFDQDSVIPPNHIEKLVKEYNLLIKEGFNVGCIGPAYYNMSSNEYEIHRMKIKLNDNSYQVKSIITSSMISKYEDLRNVDFWNEALFLDFADFDLCWRLMKAKYICCVTSSTVMSHAVGERTRSILFHKLWIEAPIRYYYETRDALYLLKTNYIPLKFRLRFLDLLFIKPLLYRCIDTDYKEKWYYIKQGWKDFEEGITGQYQERFDDFSND